MTLRFARSFLSCLATWACLICTLLVPVSARSEPASGAAVPDPDRNKAAQFFRAGQDAFQRGDYAVAAHSFEQAHQLLPSGPTIYNAARAWDRLSEASQSFAAYEEALTQADLSEAQRGHAQKRVDELRKQGIASARKPASASAPVVEAAVAPAVPSPPIIQSEASLPAAVQTEPAHKSNYLGWTGVAVAGVSAIAAATCGWVFLNQRSDFMDTGKTNDRLRNDAVLWGKLTTVALAATVMGGGVAVWGFHRGKDQARVALRFYGTGVSVGGAF